MGYHKMKVMHYWWSHAFLSIFISSISFLSISCTSFHFEDVSQFDGSDVCVPLLSKQNRWCVLYLSILRSLFLQQQPSAVSR